MSPLEIQATNGGLFGGVIATGTAIYTGKFAAIQSVGVTFGISGISAPLVTNSSYLSGKSFAHPFELSLPFDTFQLTSGAAYLRNRVD